MKITLNTSVPESQRPQIEAMVNQFAGTTSIVWLPSRFQRFVMLVEPGTATSSEPSHESIFDAPELGSGSTAGLTEALESRIEAFLMANPASA